mgnify:CR=1 FL=1
MPRKSLTTPGNAAAASDRKKPQTSGSVGNKQRQYSSTESLTSTDELIAGSSLKLITQRILTQAFQTDNHLTALLPGLLLLLLTHQLNLSALMRSMNCVHHCLLT